MSLRFGPPTQMWQPDGRGPSMKLFWRSWLLRWRQSWDSRLCGHNMRGFAIRRPEAWTLVSGRGPLLCKL